MKKGIAFLLALMLALYLAGCGASTNPPPDSSTASSGKFTMPLIQGLERPGEEASAVVALEEGREFNDFYWAFKNAESDFSNLISSFSHSKFENINSSRNFTVDEEMELHDFNLADSRRYRSDHFLDCLGYHDLDTAPQDTTQLLDFFVFKIEGSKQMNGNIITILVDTTLNEDRGWFGWGAEAGDHAYLEAKLDTESLTLNCKSSLDRAGEVLDRTEFEAVILPDGTLLYQFFHVEHPELNSTSEGEYAVFKRISGNSYSCIVTEIGSKFDFSYGSIIGRGDMTAEQMAQSYMTYGSTRVFTVEDRRVDGDTVYGKVNYEAYEPDESLREIPMNTEKPDEKKSPATDIKLILGHEFSGFYVALQDIEEAFYDFFYSYAESIPDLHKSTDFLMAYRDVINTNFWFENFFDMQDGTHLLDWPVLEATKLTSGDIVVILVDDTFKDKYSSAEKGDHMRLEVTLDTKNLTLSCERILERDGQYIERAVTEAVILADGTILFQRFIVGVDEVYGERIVVFKRISGGSYSCIIANIGTDYGYTYKSIIGRGDMTIEEMARDYAVKHVFTVENGEVNYEAK